MTLLTSPDRPAPRRIWPPETGLFSLRLVRGGWRVPARILRTEDNLWCAEVDEILCEAHSDPTLAPEVATIWHGGLMISEADYRWLLAVKAHARTFDAQHPSLHPKHAIDPMLLRPIILEPRA